MKTKLFMVVAAVLGLSFAAEAQTVSIGPRAGVNFATQRLVGDASDDEKKAVADMLKYNPGKQFGAVVNFGFSDFFALQPEFLYVEKGSKLDISGYEDDFWEGSFPEVAVKYSYLEVPVLAKISIGEGSLKGFATGGPTFGYLMSGNAEADGESEEIDVEEGFNRFELGASFGIGISYKLGPGALNLDVRYGHGLSGVLEDDEDGNMANRGFGVSLAYLFGGK